MCSLSVVIFNLLFVTNVQQIWCSIQKLNNILKNDLFFSDTNHDEDILKAQEQLIFINHGNGAVSSIHQTLMSPSVKPPIKKLSPNLDLNHRNHFNFENDIESIPFLHQFNDIQRIVSKENRPIINRKSADSIRPLNSENRNLNEPSLTPFLPSKNFHPSFTNKIDEPISFKLYRNYKSNSELNNFNQFNINPFQSFPFDPNFELNSNPPQILRQPNFFSFFEPPLRMPGMSYNQPIEANAFQRRRLTLNNNIEDNSLGIGYPFYNNFKGDQNAGTKWPKIFKFIDGRINLNDFEKDKKMGKVKFPNENYFDIRRESFLILHGGAYTYE